MISIINKEIKEENGKYYLEITLSEYVNDIWKNSYLKSLSTKGYTSMYGSGAPTVDKVEIYGNTIRTKTFSKNAKNDVKAFIGELESFIDITDKIYNAELTLIKEQEEENRRKQEEKEKVLKDFNDFINND